MEPLREKGCIVGTKQVLRALAEDKLDCVYLANDVDEALHLRLRTACEGRGVQIHPVLTMKELGQACGIQVGAACAGIPVRHS